MQVASQLRLPRGGISLPAELVWRELLRAAAAFVVYLLLYPVWKWTGLHTAYQELVHGVAGWLFLPNQHFPVVSTLDTFSIRSLHFVVGLTLALFLVSNRVAWGARIRRFGIALLLVFVFHVGAVMLQVKVTSAQELNEMHGLLVLLPQEFFIVERAKYLFYDLGLQALPFGLLIATMIWNTGLMKTGLPSGKNAARATKKELRKRQRAASEARRRLMRRRLMPAVVAAVAAAVAIGSWAWWRESHPLHVGAHATLGHLYRTNGAINNAERQYRIAIAGRSTDGQTYLRLAQLVAAQGRGGESKELLRRGLEIARGTEWAGPIEEALRTGRFPR